MWPARAASRAADVIAAYEEPVLSGKQLAPLKGIGKGTVAKVLRLQWCIQVQHTAALPTWVVLMPVPVPQIDEFLKTGTIEGADGGGGGGGGGGGEAKANVKEDAAMAANFV